MSTETLLGEVDRVKNEDSEFKYDFDEDLYNHIDCDIGTDDFKEDVSQTIPMITPNSLFCRVLSHLKFHKNISKLEFLKKISFFMGA